MSDYRLLAETIVKRRSVRSYTNAKVELLETDTDLIEMFGITPLIGDIKASAKVLRGGEIKNNRSNYCIVFYSEEKPLHLENIGFIGQQIDLELQSRGLGSCWWGMKKPKRDYRKNDGLISVITMSAGFPKDTSARHCPNCFTRKPMSEILATGTEADKLIEMARIAPSAVNNQPWLFESAGDRYNFYLRPPKGMMEKIIGQMRHVDIGITMAHLFIKAKAEDLNVSFSFDGKDKYGSTYIASITV